LALDRAYSQVRRNDTAYSYCRSLQTLSGDGEEQRVNVGVGAGGVRWTEAVEAVWKEAVWKEAVWKEAVWKEVVWKEAAPTEVAWTEVASKVLQKR
jgi:hypothetical protein